VRTWSLENDKIEFKTNLLGKSLKSGEQEKKIYMIWATIFTGIFVRGLL